MGSFKKEGSGEAWSDEDWRDWVVVECAVGGVAWREVW